MSRLFKGTVACGGVLLLGHCGLTLMAVLLPGVWFSAVSLLAICRG
jgi:hypothetical protein